MKPLSWAALVAAGFVLATLHLTAADTAKFRFLGAVYFDDKGGGLKMPEGIACDAQGRVVVGDTGNDRLLRFTYLDKTMSGGTETKVPELSAPSTIQLSSKGEIYALDGRQRRIVRLGADGQAHGPVSFEGVPPPSTIVVKSFRIDATDTLYVLDVFSARVLVLNAAGQFQKALPLPADARFVSDLAAGSGSLLLLDSIGRRLYSADKDAASFSPLGGDLESSLTMLPTSLTVSRGTIFVLEGTAGSIVSFGRDGSFLARQLTAGRNEGSLDYPSQMCINDKDEVFIADRGNSRIQIFALVR